MEEEEGEQQEDWDITSINQRLWDGALEGKGKRTWEARRGRGGERMKTMTSFPFQIQNLQRGWLGGRKDYWAETKSGMDKWILLRRRARSTT